MTDSIKLFSWLFALSVFVALFKFRAVPLAVLLMVTPTFALFQLLWVKNILSPKPQQHWLFKIPGLWWLRNTLISALALPLWVRLVIVLACIFVGLGLAKLFG